MADDTDREINRRRYAVGSIALALGCAAGACSSSDSRQATATIGDAVVVDSTAVEANGGTTAPRGERVASSGTSTTQVPTSSRSTASPAASEVPREVPDTQPFPAVLQRDDTGEAVEALQRRLTELGYWLGPIDARYGNLTEQAVFAFQKVNGLHVNGEVASETRAQLAQPATLAARSTAGTVWEIDKTRQVLMRVVDGTVRGIWNTSTGTERPYTFGGRQFLADTPPGRFEVTWEVDGIRNGSLGRLYRPKYFHPDGIAIHGYSSVPPTPASHGCVRVSNAAMDHIWADGAAPVGAQVFVYGTSPG